MPDDPYVREIGRITDDAGRILIVGVDHGAVTLRTLHTRTGGAVTLGCVQAEELGQLYIAACWEAARDIERLAVALAAGTAAGS
jgi:hypothetical protein